MNDWTLGRRLRWSLLRFLKWGWVKGVERDGKALLIFFAIVAFVPAVLLLSWIKDDFITPAPPCPACSEPLPTPDQTQIAREIDQMLNELIAPTPISAH